MKSLLADINKEKCPCHIAIIMDGNGRWAKSQGHDRLYGHANGVEAIRSVLKGAVEVGVKYLTLYAFSTENWNRPKPEVEGLMDLMVKTISNEVEELNKNNVRLNAIGDIEGLPSECREALKKSMDETAKNNGITLTVALNYSARWEILNAVKSIATKVKKGEIQIEEIKDTFLQNELATNGLPDPDLLIRTSGEFRVSNFMLWQIAYSELYFSERMWPEFTKEDLFEAILNYQSRERRFGKVSEQLKK